MVSSGLPRIATAPGPMRFPCLWRRVNFSASRSARTALQGTTAACASGFVVETIRSAGLARDIDEPADLAEAAIMSGTGHEQASVAHLAAQEAKAGGRPLLRT